MIEHYKFVQSHTKATPKMTIPSPSTLHFRFGRKVVPETIYPSMDDYYRDLGQTWSKTVRAFADAGCRYLQLDETNLTYLCDPELRPQVNARGDDPDKLPLVYAGMINAAIADIPSDMTITMHLCRGNFRSTFISAGGGYEPIAEMLFNTIKVHGYFMEYDSARSGGFEPLRFVPKGKTVVLGLVTSKSGTLESKDEIKRRIDEAAKFVDIDQLCLSPQCGFASTEEGNILAEDEQWAKLRMIVEMADEVWGKSLMLLSHHAGRLLSATGMADRPRALAKQVPARACEGSVAGRSRAARSRAGRRDAARDPRSGARRPRHHLATASSGARAIPTASPPRSTASISTSPARR